MPAEHYYTSKQSSKLIFKPLKANIRGITLDLVASSGVFSKSSIDKGTLLLIENMLIKQGWKILDLGCGYGAIGLFAAKISNAIPYLIDINKRACYLASINAKANKIEAVVLNGSLYDQVKGMKFDTILINPPQTAGKQLCFDMITGSIDYLKPAGLLQLVARPNKGGKTLSLKMKEVFGNVEVTARQSGYAVYVSKHL